MLYYTSEIQYDVNTQKTAGIKARDDINEILRSCGAKPIRVKIHSEDRTGDSALRKVVSHIALREMWDRKFRRLKSGDYLFIQYPVINHSLWFSGCIRKLKKRNIRTILLLHDLEMFRGGPKKRGISAKIRVEAEEKSVLRECDFIIAHNAMMKKCLADLGFDENKIFSLEMFDYLIPGYEEKKDPACTEQKEGVIIAGTLRPHKAAYAYHLPENVKFNLYGVGYEKGNHGQTRYFGALDPGELSFKMRGSFGLVWDGDRIDTCGGVYGEYLKINNPHKTSLYIASGFPVIIWNEAALAGFITGNHCGIAVSSLDELHSVLERLSPEEYQELVEGAGKMGQKLREGYFTKKVLHEILGAGQR